MFLVCYGGSGCRMYNWQLEEIYRTERKDRVSNVFLEHTFLIYGTTQGSLYLYDFIRRT